MAGNRPELLQRRGVQTANAVPSAAAGIGALLERHAVLLRGAGGRGLTTLTASEVVVDADVPEIPVGIDGEMIMMPTPVRCAIQPNALRVRVPRNRPGIRPPKPELDWSALRRLASWRPGPWNQGHLGRGVPGIRLTERLVPATVALIMVQDLVVPGPCQQDFQGAHARDDRLEEEVALQH